MSKKVLSITSSLRAHSNSDELAQAFARGAKEAGNTVETVSLRGKTIYFCKGCLACQETQGCIIQDNAVEIAEKVKQANVLVFATPVYYYGMAGQLKTLLDRCNPLFSSDYAFRDIYLLATAADQEASAVEGTQKGLQGWVDCFEKAQFTDTVFAGGVDEAGAIKGHPSLLTAYAMGKKIQ